VPRLRQHRYLGSGNAPRVIPLKFYRRVILVGGEYQNRAIDPRDAFRHAPADDGTEGIEVGARVLREQVPEWQMV